VPAPTLHRVLMAVCMACSAPVDAATLSMPAAQDASIFHGTASSEQLADGASGYLWVSTTAGGQVCWRRLKFDPQKRIVPTEI
jgi:hypothetical protein